MLRNDMYEYLKKFPWFEKRSGLSSAGLNYVEFTNDPSFLDQDINLDLMDILIDGKLNQLAELSIDNGKVQLADWNIAAEEEKKFVDDELRPLLRKNLCQLSDVYQSYAEAISIAALLEWRFKHCFPRPVFIDLMKIYEKGGVISGWTDEWPDGKCVVLDLDCN